MPLSLDEVIKAAAEIEPNGANADEFIGLLQNLDKLASEEVQMLTAKNQENFDQEKFEEHQRDLQKVLSGLQGLGKSLSVLSPEEEAEYEKMKADEAANPQDQKAVAKMTAAAGELLSKNGVNTEKLEEGINNVDGLSDNQKKELLNLVKQVPDVVGDYINNVGTMFKYDKKNLVNSSIGIGIAVAGVGVLALALTASNPVGWCVLAAATLTFGIALAKKAILSHKKKMKAREEEGLEVEDPTEQLSQEVLKKAKTAKGLLNSDTAKIASGALEIVTGKDVLEKPKEALNSVAKRMGVQK